MTAARLACRVRVRVCMDDCTTLVVQVREEEREKESERDLWISGHLRREPGSRRWLRVVLHVVNQLPQPTCASDSEGRVLLCGSDRSPVAVAQMHARSLASAESRRRVLPEPSVCVCAVSSSKVAPHVTH